MSCGEPKTFIDGVLACAGYPPTYTSPIVASSADSERIADLARRVEALETVHRKMFQMPEVISVPFDKLRVTATPFPNEPALVTVGRDGEWVQQTQTHAGTKR